MLLLKKTDDWKRLTRYHVLYHSIVSFLSDKASSHTLKLVHKLESTDTSLPHGLKALEDSLKTLGADLDRVHLQLLLGEKAFGNGESLLCKLVVLWDGWEAHAELVKGFTKGEVAKDHLCLVSEMLFLECDVGRHTMFSTSARLCLVCRR